MYLTLYYDHKKAKCQKIKKGTFKHETVSLFASFGKTNIITSSEPCKVRWHWCQADQMIDRYPGVGGGGAVVNFLSSLQIKYYSGNRLIFYEIQRKKKGLSGI